MGGGAPRSGSRGWWAKLLVAAVVLAAFVAAARLYLGELARQANADVCERSEAELVRAAGAGDVATVRDELQATSPDLADREGNTALGCAIPRHRSEVVAALLEAGADPNRPTGAGPYEDVPVELALRQSDLATAAALLDHGADPDRFTPPAEPPLVVAIRAKDDPTVALLLDHGADPDHQASIVPLSVAAAGGTDASVTALLAHGARPDGEPGSRPVVEAAGSGRWTAYEQLLAAGASLSVPVLEAGPETVGDAALARAAGSGTTAVVDSLLAGGADPNATVKDGPLLRAVAFRHDDVVTRLLDAGADPDRGETDELTLSVTLLAVNPDLAGRLDGPNGTTPLATTLSSVLDGGSTADVAQVQVPPLTAAIATGRTETVRQLLDRGADPNRLAADRYSPLYLAAATCDGVAVELLLAAGADPALSPPDHAPAAVACEALRPTFGP